MESLIKLIVDNGIGVACVAYLIYFSNTTMKSMSDALNQVATRLARIESKLEIGGENNEEV